MAPMALDDFRSLKRSASPNDFDRPAAKKRNLGPLRHHEITWNFDGRGGPYVPYHSGDSVDSLLTRSISLALDAVGFEAADPLAIESFRQEVEEYACNFLLDVRQSMLSCRRTEATAEDFLQALHTHQLSLRALLPHLDPPISRDQAQIVISRDLDEPEEEQRNMFLGPVLNGPPSDQCSHYVPSQLPSFPSKHTYRATAEYPDREEDPRKVRERATEEGRLGEEALRRLVGASVVERRPENFGGRNKSTRMKRDDLWRETMETMSSTPSSGRGGGEDLMDVEDPDHGVLIPKPGASTFGRISTAVNADKRFWRKPAPAPRSKSGASNGGR